MMTNLLMTCIFYCPDSAIAQHPTVRYGHVKCNPHILHFVSRRQSTRNVSFCINLDTNMDYQLPKFQWPTNVAKQLLYKPVAVGEFFFVVHARR